MRKSTQKWFSAPKMELIFNHKGKQEKKDGKPKDKNRAI